MRTETITTANAVRDALTRALDEARAEGRREGVAFALRELRHIADANERMADTAQGEGFDTGVLRSSVRMLRGIADRVEREATNV